MLSKEKEPQISEIEDQSVVALFAILREIKRRQIKADVKKYFGIDLDKFQSPRDLSAAGEKLEPSN